MAILPEKALLQAFKRTSTHFPFYAQFLSKHGVVPREIQTMDDFKNRVPPIQKEDVFLGHTLEELSWDGKVSPYTSAIVSSGTTEVFSYGLLTKDDVTMQKHMLDTLLDELFSAKQNPPIIINALPMGVSFASSYPVIPTSVRTDIIRKVITTFGKGRQVIIITDPHVLKKVLEEGIAEGCTWSEYALSAIVGGAGSSDSFITYMRSLLNNGTVSPDVSNVVLQTMGITEVALNIFGSTPDLVHLRHIVSSDDDLCRKLFGKKCRSVPEIMYHMAKDVFIEIIDKDEDGVGDLVFTHLSTEVPTPLIRYNTGDKACFVPHKELAQLVPGLPILSFPIIGMYGRESDYRHAPVTPLEVEEVLYQDYSFAQMITGHFLITGENENVNILVHMREGIESLPEKDVYGVRCVGVPYHRFPSNITLNYEYKWKHIL